MSNANTDKLTRQHTVLVAGATGSVGRAVIERLLEQGHAVRAAVRSTSLDVSRSRLPAGVADIVGVDAFDAESWRQACAGVDRVVSALGAPVALNLKDRRGYVDVDVAVHRALAEGASGVARALYVSVHPSAGYDQTRYVQAHLAVEALWMQSFPSFTAVRPTGVFSALSDLLPMAARGLCPVMGDGSARTNPVHPADVAQAIVGALNEGERVVAVGGPQVMTRDEIVACAFEALGKRPRLLHIPAAPLRAYASLLRVLHPRLGELLRFAVDVSTHDAIAPVAGERTLLDWYRALPFALAAHPTTPAVLSGS